MKDCKDPSLSSKLDETWKNAYDEGRFHLLHGILYHRTKHTCVMVLTDRTLINTILHECHDSVAAGNLSEDRKLERVKTCSLWPNWKKDVAGYFQTCERCQNANRATALPPGGDRSYNSRLVVADRYRKSPVFLPCHKDETDMDTSRMIWNKVISHTRLFQNIISDRDAKFTSGLWTNLHNLFGTKLLFSTAYHPQTDSLAKKLYRQ
ncbi:hypothetical protein O181_106076 [Austropuccinia psidii MF-1]|uniref:Integrase zinc-binding domain-containing protein n=1 Tax=Austropuccinia psidii MF-1 TaxID=1389203 RepID=A0A9Q3PMX0_9BASI|nr:hypothetical protein [Austropuccinia psidii MF-1]